MKDTRNNFILYDYFTPTFESFTISGNEMDTMKQLAKELGNEGVDLVIKFFL